MSPNTTATAAEENPFAKALEALINYFTPQKKTKTKKESLRFMSSDKQRKNPTLVRPWNSEKPRATIIEYKMSWWQSRPA